MPKRIAINCGLKKKYKDVDLPPDITAMGKCLGYGFEDEPIDECKTCKLRDGYEPVKGFLPEPVSIMRRCRKRLEKQGTSHYKAPE